MIRYNQGEAKRSEEQERLKALTSDLSFIFDEPPEEINEEEYIFYLWEENVKLWELYNLLRQYHKQYYEIDTFMLSKLIKKMKLNFLEIVEELPYLHGGFVSIMLEKKNG